MSLKESQIIWPSIGNEHITNFLNKNILNKKLAHFYVFAGPSQIGKFTYAKHLAKILFCKSSNENLPCNDCEICRKNKLDINHPDFYLLQKEKSTNNEKQNISVAQIRYFIEKIKLSSFSNSYKIGIIKDAHYLNQEAANALLKTLEESKNKIIIIFTTNCETNLLETIVSRARVLKFYPVKNDIIHDFLIENFQVKPSLAKKISHLSAGRPILAKKFLEDESFREHYIKNSNIFYEFLNKKNKNFLFEIDKLEINTKEDAKKIINIWESVLRDIFLLNLGEKDLFSTISNSSQKIDISFQNILNYFKHFQLAKKYLKTNVSYKLILENLLINLA